jgi:lipopolysaccharide export system ATP-binding protein
MASSQVFLQARGLTKSYRRRKVVDQVSLEVAAGEVVGLLGPNGAGKTTCFYMLVGLIASDAGEISLEGQPIGHLPIHRRAKMGLSYLPQENSVFRQLTVEENILAVLQLNASVQRKAQEQQLEHLLGELQIEHLRRQPAIALSGGERRRVEIARALATSPRFVLLDDPVAGVDPIAVIEIQRIVSFLRERGIGVLITDHNVRETLGICDRAYILNDGKVLADGRPPALIANEQVRKVYLGENFKM